MKSESSTKALVNVAIFSAITVMLYIIAMYIPFLDILVIIAAHLPIVLAYSRYGLKYALSSVAVTTILITFLLGPISALMFVFTNGVVGLVLGYCTTKKYNSIIVIGALILITLLSTGIVLKILTVVTGVNSLDESINMVVKSLESTLKTLKDAGINQGVVANLNVDDLKTFFYTAMPGVALVSMSIISYIYYVVTQKALRRFKVTLEPIKEFSNWYIPSRVAYPAMLMLLISMFIESEELSPLSYAIRVVFTMIFTINALSTISYFLKKRNVSKFLIGVILFLIFTMLPNILLFIGLFEYALNFRALDASRASIRGKK